LRLWETVVAGLMFFLTATEKADDKVGANRGRRSLVAGRNFARDGKKSRWGHRNPSDPGISATTPPPTVVDPYYRLSDSYYGYSDPYHGLFDLYVVPPYIPGYTYGHVRMPLR
jgi:hypothetical protein